MLFLIFQRHNPPWWPLVYPVLGCFLQGVVARLVAKSQRGFPAVVAIHAVRFWGRRSAAGQNGIQSGDSAPFDYRDVLTALRTDCSSKGIVGRLLRSTNSAPSQTSRLCKRYSEWRIAVALADPRRVHRRRLLVEALVRLGGESILGSSGDAARVLPTASSIRFPTTMNCSYGIRLAHRQPAHFHLIGAESKIGRTTPSVQSDG